MEKKKTDHPEYKNMVWEDTTTCAIKQTQLLDTDLPGKTYRNQQK